MKLIKSMCDKFTKVVEGAAKSAAGSASWSGYHQPQEPKDIKKIFK